MDEPVFPEKKKKIRKLIIHIDARAWQEERLSVVVVEKCVVAGGRHTRPRGYNTRRCIYRIGGKFKSMKPRRIFFVQTHL